MAGLDAGQLELGEAGAGAELGHTDELDQAGELGPAGLEDAAPILGDIAGELGDIIGELGDIAEELGDIIGELGDIAGELGDIAGELDIIGEELMAGEDVGGAAAALEVDAPAAGLLGLSDGFEGATEGEDETTIGMLDEEITSAMEGELAAQDELGVQDGELDAAGLGDAGELAALLGHEPEVDQLLDADGEEGAPMLGLDGADEVQAAESDGVDATAPTAEDDGDDQA